MYTPLDDPQSDFAKRLKAKAAASREAANLKNGMKDLIEGRGDDGVERINPYLIEIESDWNSRNFEAFDNITHVTDLALSIKSEGVKSPLTLKYESGRIILRDGESRLRATLLAINDMGAEIVSVPFIRESKSEGAVDSMVSQYLRNTTKPFSALESGVHCKKLVNLGLKVEEIATRLGLSYARVDQFLRLHAAPESIKQMVEKGEISSTQALQTVNACKGDMEKAAETLSEAVGAARAEGRERATGRHLKDPATRGLTAKKLVAEILDKAIAEDRLEYAENGKVVKITLSREDWNRIDSAVLGGSGGK